MIFQIVSFAVVSRFICVRNQKVKTKRKIEQNKWNEQFKSMKVSMIVKWVRIETVNYLDIFDLSGNTNQSQSLWISIKLTFSKAASCCLHFFVCHRNSLISFIVLHIFLVIINGITFCMLPTFHTAHNNNNWNRTGFSRYDFVLNISYSPLSQIFGSNLWI